MTTLKKLRDELEQLKSEILSKRATPNDAASVGLAGDKKEATLQATIETQIKELNRMVKTMLDEAESTVSDHPVATVAGALALGIAIGRVSSR